VTEERAQEAVAHLQQAALEFIEAARAVLDVAEEAVREPGGVLAVIADTVGGLAAALGEVRQQPAPQGREQPPSTAARGHVEHIRIS
jgi:hypothetical protein